MNHGAAERGSLVLHNVVIGPHIFLQLEETLPLLEMLLVFIIVWLGLERGEAFGTEPAVDDVWLVADVGIEHVRVIRARLCGISANLAQLLPFRTLVCALECLSRWTVVRLHGADFLLDWDLGFDLTDQCILDVAKVIDGHHFATVGSGV